MPRYFFHFASQCDRIPDVDGVELESLPAAHRHALRLVRETVAMVADAEGWRGWRVEIDDAARRRALTVLFPVNAPPLRGAGEGLPTAGSATSQARR